MMNKITAIGRLTADPQQNTVGGVPCTNFSLACDTRQKDQDGNTITNFYRVSAWRGLADTCAKFLHKGDRVAVVGDLVLRSYVDKEGTPRSAMQITMTDVCFLGDRKDASGNSGAATTASAQKNPARSAAPEPVVSDDDDDLPF